MQNLEPTIAKKSLNQTFFSSLSYSLVRFSNDTVEPGKEKVSTMNDAMSWAGGRGVGIPHHSSAGVHHKIDRDSRDKIVAFFALQMF